jgi:hypothetical protein
MSEQRQLLNELDVIQDEIWRLKKVERDTKSRLDFLEKQREEKFFKLLDLKDLIA